MYNQIEKNTLIAKIIKLINDSQDLSDNEFGLLSQAQSLLAVLVKDAKPLSQFESKYSALEFTYSPGDSLPLEIRSPITTTRAEAIDLRNQLVADGLAFFRLFYGDSGDFVEPVRDTPESGAVEKMQRDWPDWKVRRARNEAYYLRARQSYDADQAQSTADSMADHAKERYPWAIFVVRVPIIVGDGEPARDAQAKR